jgi:hypothetical protein
VKLAEKAMLFSIPLGSAGCSFSKMLILPQRETTPRRQAWYDEACSETTQIQSQTRNTVYFCEDAVLTLLLIKEEG